MQTIATGVTNCVWLCCGANSFKNKKSGKFKLPAQLIEKKESVKEEPPSDDRGSFFYTFAKKIA